MLGRLGAHDLESLVLCRGKSGSQEPTKATHDMCALSFGLVQPWLHLWLHDITSPLASPYHCIRRVRSSRSHAQTRKREQSTPKTPSPREHGLRAGWVLGMKEGWRRCIEGGMSERGSLETNRDRKTDNDRQTDRARQTDRVRETGVSTSLVPRLVSGVPSRADLHRRRRLCRT